MNTCQDCPHHKCPQLVARALQGDAEATSELTGLLHERFTPVLTRMLHDADDVDEAFQEACLRLFSRLSQWNEECPFCLYFRVIAVREAINILRRRRRRQRVEQPLGERDVADEPHRSAGRGGVLQSHGGGAAQSPDWIAQQLAAVSVEVADCLRVKIDTASDQVRFMLTSLLEGRKRREIAKSIGITPQAVGLRIAKVREWVAECWK